MRSAKPVPAWAWAALLAFAAALGAHRFWLVSRGPLAGRAAPPTTELRVVGEIGPLRARWLAFDARVQAAEADAKAADWPDMLKEALELAGESAQVQLRFSRDMAGLVSGRDAVTGMAREELAGRAWEGMEELSTCILQLSEKTRRLHQLSEERNAFTVRKLAEARARYQRSRPACLASAMRGAAAPPKRSGGT